MPKHPRHTNDVKEPYKGPSLKDLDFTKEEDIRRAFEQIRDWSARVHDAVWHNREALQDHQAKAHNAGQPPDPIEPPPDPPFGT